MGVLREAIRGLSSGFGERRGGGGGLGSGRRVLKWVYHNSLRHSKLGIIWLCPPLCEVTRVRQATTGFAPEDFYLFTGKSV